MRAIEKVNMDIAAQLREFLSKPLTEENGEADANARRKHIQTSFPPYFENSIIVRDLVGREVPSGAGFQIQDSSSGGSSNAILIIGALAIVLYFSRT